MAVSIGGILFSVGMNTSGFEAGAKKIADLETKMKNQAEQNRLSQIQDARKLNKLRLKMEKAKADYIKKNQELTEASTKEEKKAVEKLLQSYKKLQNSYEKSTDALREKVEMNNLNIRQMKNEIAETKKLEKAQGMLGKSFKALGTSALAYFSVGKIKQFIDEIDQLGKRAKDFGITADGLRYLQEQASFSGVGISELDDGLKTLKKAFGDAIVGTGSQAEAFKKLGVELKDTNGKYKSFGTILSDVADGFQRYKGTADEAKVSEDLLGGSGQKVTRIFAEGSKAIREKINTIGEYSKAVESVADMNDTITETSNSVGKLLTGGAYILSTMWNVVAYGMKGESYMDKLSRKRHEQYLANIEQQKAQEEQARIAVAKAQHEQTQKDVENYEKVEEAQKRLAESRMSDSEKLKYLQNEINILQAEALGMNEFDERFIEKRVKILEKTIEYESLLKNIKKAQTDDLKNAFNVLDAEAKADKKKAEDEAKKLAEKQKEILLARQEFELQFKISKLEKGNAKEQAEAQAIKNSIKRNELMQKYGYDIKTATQALKAMRDLENQGKYKYSDKDVAKAKRIVERSQSGKNVGKKTLAQAQAILSGSALSSDRVAMFSDVKALQQGEMQFANIPAGSTSPVVIGADATATPLSATPVANQQQQNSENVFQKILDAITGLGEQIKEVFSE